jgi:hypothetical protein
MNGVGGSGRHEQGSSHDHPSDQLPQWFTSAESVKPDSDPWREPIAEGAGPSLGLVPQERRVRERSAPERPREQSVSSLRPPLSAGSSRRHDAMSTPRSLAAQVGERPMWR